MRYIRASRYGELLRCVPASAKDNDGMIDDDGLENLLSRIRWVMKGS